MNNNIINMNHNNNMKNNVQFLFKCIHVCVCKFKNSLTNHIQFKDNINCPNGQTM